MLNVVVFPAPLGPMMPTISHSPTARLTSLAACTPPKRMEQLRTSSTDIGDLHLLGTVVVQVEPVPREPALERTDLLPDPAREADEGQDEQQRPDDERGQLGRQLSWRRDRRDRVLDE